MPPDSTSRKGPYGPFYRFGKVPYLLRQNLRRTLDNGLQVNSIYFLIFTSGAFKLLSKVILRSLWFCIEPMLCDCATFSTNQDSLACIFLCLALATCIFLVHWIAYACCDWSELLLWFWFYDSQLKLIYINFNG